MDRQKVVVVLLLITIILSIFSVVLTIATSSDQNTTKEVVRYGEEPRGQVSFAITPESERGGNES